MIAAVIFDLDGTLVQTERLKGLSYARAAVELRPTTLTEAQVFAAFTDVVGLSRQEVAEALMRRFDLEAPARERMAALGVDAPWRAYAALRLRLYEEMLADPVVIRASQWPHNVALLRAAQRNSCRIALTTMSYRPQAYRVLDVLDLTSAFAFIATRDDVTHGKPDPEIYLLTTRALGVEPGECLAIEDSPAGVRAALAAGTNVIAVTTPLTRQKFRDTAILDRCWVVEDPATLPAVVQQRIDAHQHDKHGGEQWTWV